MESISAKCVEYLLQPLTKLPGVGAVTASQLEVLLNRIDVTSPPNVLSLLLHLPTGLIVRRPVNSLSELLVQPSLSEDEAGTDSKPTRSQHANKSPSGQSPLPGIAAQSSSSPKQEGDNVDQPMCLVRIKRHYPPPFRGGRSSTSIPYRVSVVDSEGMSGELVFFRPNIGWISRSLPESELRFISARASMYRGKISLSHPQIMTMEEARGGGDSAHVYGLTAGLTKPKLQSIISRALAGLQQACGGLNTTATNDPDYKTLGFCEALYALHDNARTDIADTKDPCSPARQRIVHDILFGDQIGLALQRQQAHAMSGMVRKPQTHLSSLTDDKENATPENQQFQFATLSPSPPVRPSGSGEKLIENGIDALGFNLTGAQEQAVHDIRQDLEAPKQMLRLLQGDVGSGKTAVAWIAMLAVVAAGEQSVFLAPTTLLATQHYRTISRLSEQVGIKCVLLSQRLRASEHRAALAAIDDGSADIIVGTHAVFQTAVNYKRLGFAVIDEQHRFGVQQRLALAEKGAQVDTLLMSATPIPRSLAMSRFGDLEMSILDEKPPGRKDIETKLIKQRDFDNAVALLQSEINAGSQAYWVCPAIDENEDLAATAVETRFEHLSSLLGSERVCRLHSALSGDLQDDARNRFEQNKVDVLVATTMVEVGVDVANATLMVIESAERFGLAQLHQLRGRVGRNSDGRISHCILLHSNGTSPDAYRRLRVISECQDGFIIAEHDLRQRGSGELLGTRQSGLPYPWLYDPELHEHLLVDAHITARKLVLGDPDLESSEGNRARALLRLTRGDTGASHLRAG